VQYAAKRYDKIGMLTYSGEIGASSTAAATKSLTELGKPPVATLHYNPLDPDVAPQLRQLQMAGAEAIITQGVPEDAATILKGMEQIGYKAQVFGHLSFCDPIVRNLALEAAQGAYCIDSVDPRKPGVQKLMDAYKKKYGGDGLVYWLPVVHGYDAVLVLAEALKEADFDNNKLMDAMESIKDFPAVSGNKDNRISFGPDQHDGNRENAVLLMQIRGKDLIEIE
jgi:branched-chain amino acid transport system substrate-binding protein